MINVISLGAGKQSIYMLLQAITGVFGEIPDFAIFSDTGSEPEYVYEYLNWFKKNVKFPIITVSEGNLMNDTKQYLNGKKKRVASLPLRLGKTGGLIMRQCTNDYKIKPVRKYLQKIRGKEKVKLWIGISLDEMERAKDSNVKYIQNYYPLIDKRIRIDQIVNFYKTTGLKEPGKSACLICPFHSDNYWKRLKKEFPREFEKACLFDDLIRNYPGLQQKTYLSKHLIPLRDVNLDYVPSLFPELIEECNGLCGL